MHLHVRYKKKCKGKTFVAGKVKQFIRNTIRKLLFGNWGRISSPDLAFAIVSCWQRW
jgi:hypothetical protein